MTDTVQMITSVQNPKIKAVTKLHQRKYREQEGLILIEGQHPMQEALSAGVEILEVYVLENEPTPDALSIIPVWVTEQVMAKLSTTDSPVPILAVAKRPEHALTPLLQQSSWSLLTLLGLQDPGNVGTLIRSACAFQSQGVVLIGPHVDPYNPKVIRASAGLVFRIPVIELGDWNHLESELASIPDAQIWGADAHQGQSYRTIQYGSKTIILLGGEPHGLPQTVWPQAKPLHIPMADQAESLNVATSGAIILSEIYQQQVNARHSTT